MLSSVGPFLSTYVLPAPLANGNKRYLLASALPPFSLWFAVIPLTVQISTEIRSHSPSQQSNIEFARSIYYETAALKVSSKAINLYSAGYIHLIGADMDV